MPSLEPLPGRCGAARKRYPDPVTGELKPQTYCKNKPDAGRTRCKFHGGAVTGKHGLYAHTLATAWPSDGLNSAEMFAQTPATVSLDHEIRLARVKVARWQMMLAKGERFFEYVMMEEVCEPTDSDEPQLPCKKPVTKSVSCEYLLERAMDQLRRLVKTQHDMLPGAEVGGNLRVAVVIIGGDGKPRPRVPMIADDAEVMEELKDLEELKPKTFLKREPDFDGGYNDEEPDA